MSTEQHEISLDQHVALKGAAQRLAEHFSGTFNKETIERFLVSSYDEFADRATLTNFLPLLTERFAKQRLQVLRGLVAHAIRRRVTVVADHARVRPISAGYSAGASSTVWRTAPSMSRRRTVICPVSPAMETSPKCW